MVKALIAGLLVAALVIALAASGFLSAQRERQPAAMPIGESRAALLLLQKEVEGFASANAPWRFRFPLDHAAHPDHRTESWHFNGSVSTPQGRRFGFQLTFFRIGIKPPAAPLGPSAWAARDVYWAQFALTDASGNRFHAFERLDRAAMGLSGSEPSPLQVWLGDWVMEVRDADGGGVTFDLRAAQDGIGIELSLRGAKAPAIPAAGGAIRDGLGPITFHAYLMTRLRAKGTIQIERRIFEVEGHAWLDRAWGLVPVPLGPVVWDRFLLQLDDERELMGLRLRRRDGSGEPIVTGLLVERDGSIRALAQGALTIDVLDRGSSAQGGTRFPAQWQWRLRIPDDGIELRLTPYVAAQERRLSLHSWAGAVRISGTANGQAVEGNGHVELAGYGERARRP